MPSDSMKENSKCLALLTHSVQAEGYSSKVGIGSKLLFFNGQYLSRLCCLMHAHGGSFVLVEHENGIDMCVLMFCGHGITV